MEGYYDFFQNVMLSLGIESEIKSKYSVPITLLRYSTIIFMTSLMMQSFLFYVFDDNEFSYFTVASISQVFFIFQGIIKLLTVVFKNDHLIIIINRLKEVFRKLDKLEKEESSKFLKKMSKYCSYVFAMQMTCVWIFNSLPFVSFISALLRGSEFKKLFPHAIWWQFNPFEHYIPVLLFDLYLGHVMMVVQNIFDLYFVLMLADFVTHFERLGERIHVIINSSTTEKTEETRRKLHDCLILHDELLHLFDELNGIFENSLLVQILLSSFVVCFIGIIIIVMKTSTKTFFIYVLRTLLSDSGHILCNSMFICHVYNFRSNFIALLFR